MKRKKLPIGIQTFSDIRSKEDNWIYIDKTEHAFELIDRAKYYFYRDPDGSVKPSSSIHFRKYLEAIRHFSKDCLFTTNGTGKRNSQL